MRVLITGGSGFIGSHMIEHYMVNTSWDIVVLDSLTYAGSLMKLTDSRHYDSKRIRFVYHDIRASLDPVADEIGQVDFIIHAAAMSHVENSIHNPVLAFQSNGIGTVNMLNFARRQANLQRFHYVSTDEVYGPNDDAGHVEGSPHRPSNPYSCGKSWGEKACYTYSHCYGLPVTVTNTMNNFGERQHPEKFVPMVMRACLSADEVQIHARQRGEEWEVGSRFWLHARNHADAIMYLFENRARLDGYAQFNVVGDIRMDNLSIAKRIEKHVQEYREGAKLHYALFDFHADRPGHDLHYGLDGTKLEKFGWVPPVNFADSFKKMVRWTLDNQRWLRL